MTNTKAKPRNLMSWAQVASLIVAFFALGVALPYGLTLDMGDARNACGVIAAVSITWLAAFLTFAPRD